MAAKLNTTKRISLQGGSAASGKTVPGPGALRGGGHTAATVNSTSKGGGTTPGTGTGYGTARGINKGK